MADVTLSGVNVPLDVDTKNSSKKLDRLCKNLEKVADAANKAMGALNGVKDAVPAGSDGEEKTNDKKNDGASGLMGMLGKLKSIVLYRIIRRVLTAIVNAIKEGMQNLYQYSKLFGGTFSNSMDRATTTALYLKNALATLFAPFVEMAVPLFEAAVDKIVDFINKLNEAIAALRGQATYTKAIKYWKEYAKAVKGATISIDELNVIGDNQLDYSKMFEPAEVDKNLKKDLEGISKVLAKISELLGIIFGFSWEWLSNKIGFFLFCSEKSAELWGELEPLVSSVVGLVGDLADIIKPLWDEMYEPLKDLINLLVDVLKPILATIVFALTAIVGLIRVLIQGLKDPWNGDNWKTAWDNYTADLDAATKKLDEAWSGAGTEIGDDVGKLIDDLTASPKSQHYTGGKVVTYKPTASLADDKTLVVGKNAFIGGYSYNPYVIESKLTVDGKTLAKAVQTVNNRAGVDMVKKGYVM